MSRGIFTLCPYVDNHIKPLFVPTTPGSSSGVDDDIIHQCRIEGRRIQCDGCQ